MTSRDFGASEPPPSRMRLSFAVAGLSTYLCLVLAATLSPTPLDRGYESSILKVLGVLHRNGVPEWFGYTKLEFSANVVMFFPLGFFLALALPWRVWWVSLLVVPALSGLIELTQAAELSERFATVQDVAANTIGGYVGASAAAMVRVAVHARDRRVISRALWNRTRSSPPLSKSGETPPDF